MVQAFANAHPDQVVGVVLEDSSDPAQLGYPAFGLPHLRSAADASVRPLDSVFTRPPRLR